MSRYRVNIEIRARVEAAESFRWLYERSPTAAARWNQGLQKAIAQIAENPFIHPIADEDLEQHGTTIRQALYGRRRGVYRILYTIGEETITVLNIRHGSRGPTEP